MIAAWLEHLLLLVVVPDALWAAVEFVVKAVAIVAVDAIAVAVAVVAEDDDSYHLLDAYFYFGYVEIEFGLSLRHMRAVVFDAVFALLHGRGKSTN